MVNVTSKISKLFKSKKVNVLAVFVLLALFFSLLTKLSKDYTKTITFDIDRLNVPEQDVVLKDSLHKIDVTISTYGFAMLKYYFAKPKLKVDFNELQKTPTSYVWIKNSQFQSIVDQFNANTTVNNISPDTIKFRYDSYFVKTIPVVLNQKINFAPGFDIDGGYNLQPDSIKVFGAKSAIDSIKSIETKPLLLKEVNADIHTSVKLELPKSNADIKFSKHQVSVNGSVKKFTEGSLMIPVLVTNVPENVQIKYFPKEIEVTFYTSLEYYKTITPNSFKVECDYSKLDTITHWLVPKVTKQPDKVRNVRIDTKSIEFIIL
jgi:hypothetical protein